MKSSYRPNQNRVQYYVYCIHRIHTYTASLFDTRAMNRNDAIFPLVLNLHRRCIQLCSFFFFFFNFSVCYHKAANVQVYNRLIATMLKMQNFICVSLPFWELYRFTDTQQTDAPTMKN